MVEICHSSCRINWCFGAECWRMVHSGTSQVPDWWHAGGEELLWTNAVVHRRCLWDALHLPETWFNLPARRTGEAINVVLFTSNYQSVNQSIKNLKWIVQSTAVTVQRKLRSGKETEMRYVFSLDLNVDSVVDDVTSGGREFHVRDAAQYIV